MANPWFSIWIRPRATIREIVDSDPEHLVLLPAAVGGFAQGPNRASARSLGDVLPISAIFVIAATLAPLGAVIGLHISGWLLKFTGAWLGGRGSSVDIRAAIAWANVPLIWTLPLWIPSLALFGDEMFTSATPRLDASLSLALALLGFAIVDIVVGVWEIVVLLKCLGEVHGFSAWKALGNLIVATLVVAVPVFALPLVVLLIPEFLR